MSEGGEYLESLGAGVDSDGDVDVLGDDVVEEECELGAVAVVEVVLVLCGEGVCGGGHEDARLQSLDLEMGPGERKIHTWCSRRGLGRAGGSE